MSVPQSSPEVTRWCALFVAIVLAGMALISIASLVIAERTGSVLYASNPRLPDTERVSRSGSPEKFHEATLLLLCHALGLGGISLVSGWFYRRLSS